MSKLVRIMLVSDGEEKGQNLDVYADNFTLENK